VHVGTIGRGDFYTGFRWAKPEGKRPLGRHRHRWENNINVELKEVGLGACTGLIGLRKETGGRLV
jgi:hypothetical protein